MTDVFALLIVFQIKHLLADYFLQGRYMLGKFKREGWALPLACHAAVHAAFTYAIVFLYTKVASLAFGLAIADSLIHFAVDRVKASPNLLGRWSIDKPQFWWALGGDQMVHHFTHYAIIWVLVAK